MWPNNGDDGNHSPSALVQLVPQSPGWSPESHVDPKRTPHLLPLGPESKASMESLSHGFPAQIPQLGVGGTGNASGLPGGSETPHPWWVPSEGQQG